MNFLIFRNFFEIFLNLSKFKINLLDLNLILLFTHVTWQHVEHPIRQLICDR